MPNSVEDVREFKTKGPWTTKSDGLLKVLCAFSQELIDEFFKYNSEEIGKIPGDIRGLRIYTVRGVAEKKIGGIEFHHIREEIVFGLEGSFLWRCEDLFGGTCEFTITPECGVWMPSYILHTYSALESGSGLIVLCNTLFDPDDPQTHDTYSSDEFRVLQEHQIHS